MKLTLHSTTTIVQVNGVPARLWEGVSESGVKVHAFVTRVAVEEGEDHTEFQRELQQHEPPTVLLPLGLRMVL